ncbi:MAG: hypothetical protein C0608_02435 [Deltaproteobacteria bacterium]|nr:MAG: hypothetical protein C0608_02435 [Deltaproteobacteria bacterium]
MRFEEWCLNNYQIFVREDDKNRRSGEIRASYENSIFILKNERTLIRESIGPLKEDLKKAYEKKRQLEHSLRRSVADLERLNQDLTAQGRSMEVIDKQLSSGDIKEEGVFKNTIATKCQLEAAIMDVRERIHQLNDDKSVYAAQLEDKEEEVLSLKDHIQRKEKEETEIEEKISSAKKKYFKELEELNNKGGGPAGIP